MATKNGVLFRPTTFENLLTRLRIPFTLGLVLVATFVGPLGNFLFLFSVSNDPQSAFYGTFGMAYAGESGYIPVNQYYIYSIIGNAIWYVFLFYVAFLIPYLRLKLIKVEPDLIALSPNGRKTVRETFRMVSKATPQLVITIVFMVIYATSVPELASKGELTAFSTPIYVLRSFLRSLMFGSVLWLYCASLLGLYRFGKKELRLKSYHEDPMLGTEVLGRLSFSISSVYFLGLLLFTMQMILGGLVGQTAIINVIVLLVLVPAGLALFFAPLMCTHNVMHAVKRNEITSMRKMFSELTRTTEPVEKDDQRMIKLLTIEAIERKALSIRTWPIETPITGKLALITISVTATMIARLIQILLHL